MGRLTLSKQKKGFSKVKVCGSLRSCMFIRLGMDFSHPLNQWITDPLFQTNRPLETMQHHPKDEQSIFTCTYTLFWVSYHQFYIKLPYNKKWHEIIHHFQNQTNCGIRRKKTSQVISSRKERKETLPLQIANLQI